ncbi:hypothetical protein HU200_041285 [Digitaria exilis]|uniref:Bifunctional inhibitor/plant lipid transfer protein/seed storage helical domain-containing protein n=1 Tax=Digitaria exilis TaxID=1010633 RepID=A0A835B8X6_9POAL|nr:hypothetical protein HU200_041285 [Digitaria exilis]
MAPSNKYFLILLLVAFAVIAPNLPPSSATRAKAPAPSANAKVLHPEAEFSIPDLPIPALLPCPPLFPKIPLISCYKAPSPPPPPPSPEVKECRSSLKKLMPCASFLTDKSVFAPPSECCAALDSFYEDGAVPTCLCHLTNGGIGQLLPAPLNRRRTGPLLIVCDFQISPNRFYDVCNTLNKSNMN